MTRKIDPHIGHSYWSDGLRGFKVLILGESSYNPNGYPDTYDISKQCSHLIRDVIGWDDYRQKGMFYSRVTRILGFDPKNKEIRIDFWSRVSFCNYLQVILPRPREVPPGEAWINGRQPFFQTVRELKPDYVLVFSKRLWPHLPKSDDVSILTKSGTYARQARFEHDDASVTRVLNFKHPSSRGFAWQRIREVLDTTVPGLCG